MRARLRQGTALALGLLLIVQGCGWWREQGPEDDGVEAPPQGPRLPYEVVFEGELPSELHSYLEQASNANQEVDRPPSSELMLRQRAEADLERLAAALRAEGYYDGSITFRIERIAPGEGSMLPVVPGLSAPEPVARVVYRVTPGARYTFAPPEIVVSNSTFAAPPPATLGLVAGEPARAQAVLDAETELLRIAKEQGFALAATRERETIVDHPSRRMEVTLRVDGGPGAKFGDVALRGIEGIDSRFVRRRLPFQQGERYDSRRVEEGRDNLVATGLFSTVVEEQGDALNAVGELPISFEMRQRAARSIGIGLDYKTDEGPGISGFWENRNMFGAGERLRAELEANTVRQEATFSLRKPDFYSRLQSLLVDGSARRETTDAYDSLSVGAGAAVERMLARGLVGSVGLAYRYASIEEQGEEEQTYGLLSVPAKLDWDFSNDLLDPTRGGRLQLMTAPTWDTLGLGRSFLKTRLDHSRYLPISEGLVLALRGALGSIVGTGRDDLPADERFYAGGGGSVRGIAYQTASELDEDDDPLGGASLVELSAELRYRFTENLGAVLFIDGGAAFDNAYPDFDQPLRWGVGPGLRYYTPIGPLRLDIGIPLDARDGVDDAFQLYISIGQAF